MKVLHVISEMGAGGAESLVAEMVRRGPDVGWESALASSGGLREDALVAEGAPVRTYRVPTAGRSVPGVGRAVAATRAAIRDFAPDVIVAHNVGATTTATLGSLAALRRVPVVSIFHGVSDADFGASAKILSRLPRHVVSVSEVSGRRITDGGLSGVPHTVIPNAITPPPEAVASEARRELGLDDVPTALCLARLVEQKRHDVLLDAWALVPEPAVLLVAGDGPLRGALEAQATRLGLGDRVRFLGVRRDAPRLLAAADVTVLSSDWEGLPVAVLESMAAGRPVVATQVDGLAEAVVPGTGTLVPRRDPAALAEALTDLLYDDDKRAAYGAAARARVVERHDPHTMMTSYDRTMRTVVGRAAAQN